MGNLLTKVLTAVLELVLRELQVKEEGDRRERGELGQ